MIPSLLAVTHPFLDRTKMGVSDEFIKEQNLDLGVSNPAKSEEELEASWEAAEGKIAHESYVLGGTGMNVIKVLSWLGRLCAIYGKKGAGVSGEEVEDRLKKLNITSFLIEDDELPGGKVNCFISPEKERTMHTYPGAAAKFSAGDIEPDYFKDFDYVYLEGYLAYSPGALSKCVECASEKKIALDLASVPVVEKGRQEFLSVIRKVDVVFGNIKEFEALAETQELEKIIAQFSSKQIVVITDGKNGCWVRDAHQNELIHYPAHNVPKENIVATTGAGDYLAAGFLNGLMLGESIATCVEMGNLAASSVIQVAPAELPEDDWKKLIQQIRAVQKV